MVLQSDPEVNCWNHTTFIQSNVIFFHQVSINIAFKSPSRMKSNNTMSEILPLKRLRLSIVVLVVQNSDGRPNIVKIFLWVVEVSSMLNSWASRVLNWVRKNLSSR